MTYRIGDIFTNDEEYTVRAIWCNEHEYYIDEIEPLEDGTRQFKICAPAQKSEEEIKVEHTQQAVNELEAQLAGIKERMVYAMLIGDDALIQSIREEYSEVMNG